ncbi:MAG TPA: 3-hydroxybutyrate oligomer hydrolase family protein [Casimicrobiaceae bacterium]|nr:3-hydroxybutyrate oligomer hydrolase family protein [Casimicrobiaceae bacterium]
MHFHHSSGRSTLAGLVVAALVAGCGGGGGGANADVNVLLAFLSQVKRTVYDGTTDDLLTAGLGRTGLAGAAPAIANPTAPTTAELRRLAIYNNYRALVPVVARGGYGVLFGPNIDANGADTRGEGRVAGVEYLAYADDGSGTKNVTLMVQIPNNWDRTRPCIVTGTSSGSRGVYGAIGTSGEWGLKRGCAVAYADKGTGMGVHDLATDTVNLQQGQRSPAAAAGPLSNFTSLIGSALAAFHAAHPNRIAVKHAHSQQNPERDWGLDTLNAIRFAIYALNEESGLRNPDGSTRRPYNADNTLVIGSSVSNGGGAALAAAEQDVDNLIDGIAVSEPQIQLVANSALRIQRGTTVFTGTGRTLYDYVTLANLYQPCATLSTRAAGSPGGALVPAALATNRCAALRTFGLLTKATVAEQAEEAMDIIIAAGWEPSTSVLQASHYAFVTPAIAVTYANAYGRFSVTDNVCGFSFAAVDAANRPAPIALAALATVFSTGNGIPPMSTIQIINNLSVGGPLRDAVSVSPSTGQLDFNADGARCLRNLWTGTDALAARVKSGNAEVLRTANLRGKPAIIVHGRQDTNTPPAFTSRPYFGLNKIVEGTASRLSYIEVTNAQHLDAFIDNALLPGYDSMYVPLHYYFFQALDRMYAHLTTGAALPPSQVVRAVPRGGTPGSAPAITLANLPAISATPASGNAISFSNNTVTIPD